jgi:hypothetical protein
MRVKKTVIEGGSAAHRRLLGEIFSGLGQTQIQRVSLEDRPALFGPGHRPTPEEISAGTGLVLRLLEPSQRNARVKWEMSLVAAALKELALRDQLTQIVWVDFGSGGYSLRPVTGLDGPMSSADVGRMRVEIQRAADLSGATVERLDILRPLGHAWAVRLHVEEPHSYLRQQIGSFFSAVEPWRSRCGGQRFIEVWDDQSTPVLVDGKYGQGGSGGLRSDVKCCDPFLRFSRGHFTPPPAPCPVFD